jgi:hypothetical protein
MPRRKFRLIPHILAVLLFLCCLVGISPAVAELRMHGLEIFRSGEFVITSKNVTAGLAKTNDQAALRKRWCRPQVNINVYAPDASPFQGNREGLKRVLEEFRTFLSQVCPEARALSLSGFAADGSKYRPVYIYTIRDLSAGIALADYTGQQVKTETPRPELSPKPVRLPVTRSYQFRYYDVTKSPDYKGEIGVEPIEEVNASLFQSGYKCLASRSVNFSVSNPRPRLQLDHFGNKRYVIFCSGQCQNLTYRFVTRGLVFHMGTSLPVPVVQFVPSDIGHGDVPFEFFSDNPNATGTITVSQWSPHSGDYGGGCAGTMFEQPKPN